MTNEIKNEELYKKFIEELRSMSSTEEILFAIFNYFKTSVTYNYDELQVVKYQRGEDERLLFIKDLMFQNRTNTSAEFKETLVKLLDEAFLKIEGRPLTTKNKYEWFKNYGMIIHHEAKPARTVGMFNVRDKDAYDEIIKLTVNNYPPIYESGLLKDGVCAEYSIWIKRICDELNIPCLKVRGKGTTGHSWNLIYITEKNTWVNFDMTMVRFYLDNWSQEYGEPENWVCATNEEMFGMQPSRFVYEIIDDDKVLFESVISANNQNELNEFLLSLKSEDIPKR